jgi:hypothetical protein
MVEVFAVTPLTTFEHIQSKKGNSKNSKYYANRITVG